MSATSTEARAQSPQSGEQDTCAVCGSARFVPHFRRSAAPVEVGLERKVYRITHSHRRLVHAIVRCTDCGLVTLPPALRSTAHYGDAEDPYYLEQADQRVANARRLLALVPAGGRLLDIGCACGFLLLAARELGFSAEGVEMSAWASEYARRQFGLPVRTGCLETLDLPPASYDVVVMADTIEHLTDPRTTIRHIHRVLRPEGRLLLLTPDIGSVVARLAGARWWGLLDDHYYYFSRLTLRRLLEDEGFAIDAIRALGRQFPLAHWIFKLSQYSAGLHRVAARLTRALGIDRWQISINVGDQMACVARRR